MPYSYQTVSWVLKRPLQVDTEGEGWGENIISTPLAGNEEFSFKCQQFMGDSKFDRNRFHLLSIALLLVTTGDKPTVITVWGFRIAEKISTAA